MYVQPTAWRWHIPPTTLGLPLASFIDTEDYEEAYSRYLDNNLIKGIHIYEGLSEDSQNNHSDSDLDDWRRLPSLLPYSYKDSYETQGIDYVMKQYKKIYDEVFEGKYVKSNPLNNNDSVCLDEMIGAPVKLLKLYKSESTGR